MQFLLFTLYAPMGAFGEIAVGERRMSWARPGRSAVLGLVAAALGIERDAEDAHRDLEAGFYFAVRTDASGRSLIDYHTAQAPKARKGRSFSTRREELLSSDLNTVLSSREWRSDVCFTVTLWPRPDSAVALDVVARALREPHFTLYLGRKAAPLGLPLNPAIVEANTFMEAFEMRQPIEGPVLKGVLPTDGEPIMIAFDHDAPGAPADVWIERRRDAVASRRRWQFEDRLEGVFP